jgi:hypothetical protein
MRLPPADALCQGGEVISNPGTLVAISARDPPPSAEYWLCQFCQETVVSLTSFMTRLESRFSQWPEVTEQGLGLEPEFRVATSPYGTPTHTGKRHRLQADEVLKWGTGHGIFQPHPILS